MLQVGTKSMRRTASSPGFDTYKAPKRLSIGAVPTHKFEDEHHSFFVPASMKHAGEHKLHGNYSLPRLSKDKKLAATMGDGTGFRARAPGPTGGPSRRAPTTRSR